MLKIFWISKRHEAFHRDGVFAPSHWNVGIWYGKLIKKNKMSRAKSLYSEVKGLDYKLFNLKAC